MSHFRGWCNPLKSPPRARDFVGFDIETVCDSSGVKSFYLGGISSDSVLFQSYDKDAFCEELCSKKYAGKYFVATNLSFDFLLSFYGSRFWSRFSKIVFRGSSVLFAVLEHSNRQQTIFIDTLNFAPFSVEKLGVLLDLPKLSPPSFLGVRPACSSRERRLLEEYNLRDCEISRRYMVDLYQPVVMGLGGSVQVTGASSALNIYRSSFMPFGFCKESVVLGRDVRDLILSSYYGGRCEVFARGRVENAFYYDINALYASSMLHEFPVPQSVVCPPEPSFMNIMRFEGVSTVRIICPYMLYPFLPVRRDKKLIFPVGTIVGSYNHHELRFAVSLGYRIVAVTEQIIYTQKAPIFKDYSECLYNKRLEFQRVDNPMEGVVKLLSNALYGKWGQSPVMDTQFFQKDDVCITDFTSCDDYDIYGDVVITRSLKNHDPVFSFPILSSYCTGYARIIMYPYIRDYNALYTDTDSIFTYSEIEHSNRLGMMKLVRHINDGVIVRPKLYRINDKVKSKGFSRLSPESFNSLLSGDKVFYNKLSQMKESVRFGMSLFEDMVVEKAACVEDNKRVWKKPFNKEELQFSVPITL